MKHTLQLKLTQHLTLTPQLQQSIRLLQLSTVELNQELERYLAENPLLERAELTDEGSAGSTRDVPGADSASGTEAAEPTEPSSASDEDFTFADEPSGGRSASSEEGDFTEMAAAEPTLQESLIRQLQLTPLSDRDKYLALLVITHLDGDGYLGATLEELHALALSEWPEVELEEVLIALRQVQNLEPTGVAARDLAECLGLQLKALPAGTPHRDTALALVAGHLEALAARDYNRLRRVLDASEEELRAVRALIVSLDPKPGHTLADSETRYVVPDVIVRKASDKWVASLNRDAMPRLRVNKMYADLLQASRQSGASNLAGQLQEARWLIKNVRQRFDTILRVTQSIVDRQRSFFEHGEVAMRPLVLREIADAVGLHESTISRVTTQKYMLTPRGLFELKYFFGSHVSTDTGGACSATAIRALIKQLVAAEDGKRPLSDHRISDLLAQQGIQVARRTVAKYRETLHIQPASQRRAL